MIPICRSKWSDSNGIIPCSSIIVIIAIDTCSSTTLGIHTIIMNLGTFQLCHVNGIRIFFTSCHVSNLAGNILRSIADRSSSPCRFPNTSLIFTVVSSRRIITDYILIDRSYRIDTQGDATFFLCVGIVTYHDDIGNTSRQCLISSAKNNIVGNIICQSMVITDDNQIIVRFGLIAIRLT